MKRILFTAIIVSIFMLGFSSCGSSSSVDKYSGTWTAPGGWSFQLDARTMSAVVEIDGQRMYCDWEFIDSSQGIVVGPCRGEYFIISPNGKLYATNLKTRSRTPLMTLKHKK